MKPVPRCPILLYHSQNVAGNDYASNDHVALARDLRLIRDEGYRVIPLNSLVSWLNGDGEQLPDNSVCISFDDGVDADVDDLDFPAYGQQRSFLNILRDFRAEFGANAQPHLHATSFVIASPQARAAMDRYSLFDKGWMSQGWWRRAHDSGLLAIGNHSWDHEHPDLQKIGGHPAGVFYEVDNIDKANRQIAAAGEHIADVMNGPMPDLFAYPYGQFNDYLYTEYLPGHDHHGLRGALTTEPQPVHAGTDRWLMGRYVCGRDWRSETGLRRVLAA